MPEWVRTDIEYGCRMAWITISNRLCHRAGISLPSVAESTPEVLEKIAYDMIEELRPEWMGGVIFSIKYKVDYMYWEILFAHRSLEPQPVGNDFPRIPIVQER